MLHAYLPGTYMVKVEALTAGKSLFHRATIHVVLPVKAVILKCPKVVVRHQNNIDIWIHVEEGTDLSVIWRMKDPGGQELLGEISDAAERCLSVSHLGGWGSWPLF